MKVAVVAHRKKSLDGGLVELRELLARYGVTDPLWFEVPKSKKAPKFVRQALDAGVDRVFVWGGDGTVQRSLDVLAGTGVPMAVLPAGTGNLFAGNLNIPVSLERAVRIGLQGDVHTIDVGRINGERFGVMAGVGADALMIRDADGGLKDRLGRGAYVLTGIKNVTDAVVRVRVDVDGKKFYSGKAGCVIVGNVGRVWGGIDAFDDATPYDGKLDVAVITATNASQWARVLGRAAVGRTAKAKHVQMTSARKIDIALKSSRLYQVDGGDRTKTQTMKVRVEPRALMVCVPNEQAT
ncbi:MAG: diacylglycerol kinase family lipid kinase [Actinomycetia bacterium]|nr:diacylglycerol kinase family lipid kinase [Actinomycetes bacterium]